MVWRRGLIWSGRVVRTGSVARAKRALSGNSARVGVWRGQAGEAGGGQPVAGGLARGAGRLQPIQQRHQLLHLRHNPPLLGEGRERNDEAGNIDGSRNAWNSGLERVAPTTFLPSGSQRGSR